MRTPLSLRLGMLISTALPISVTLVLAQAPARPAPEPDATSLLP